MAKTTKSLRLRDVLSKTKKEIDSLEIRYFDGVGDTWEEKDKFLSLKTKWRSSGAFALKHRVIVTVCALVLFLACYALAYTMVYIWQSYTLYSQAKIYIDIVYTAALAIGIIYWMLFFFRVAALSDLQRDLKIDKAKFDEALENQKNESEQIHTEDKQGKLDRTEEQRKSALDRMRQVR